MVCRMYFQYWIFNLKGQNNNTSFVKKTDTIYFGKLQAVSTHIGDSVIVAK